MRKKLFITAALFPLLFSLISYQTPPAVPDYSELHIRKGLPSFFSSVAKKDTVVVAYLGGSITSAPGYRVQMEEVFRKKYPETNIKSINAGLGGTGSDLGAFRLYNDVLKYNPDLVFVEYAVNDYGTDTAVTAKAMEGIIRQIKKHNSATAICLLYTLSRPMLEDLKNEQLVRSMRVMERLAGYYGIPSINMAVEVMTLLKKDELVFESKDSADSRGRIIFSNDGVHPTKAGHKVYTQVIDRSLSSLERLKGKPVKKMPASLFPGNFEKAVYLSPASFTMGSGWKTADAAPPSYRYTQALPELRFTGDPNDSLVIKFKGTILGIEDIVGPTSCGLIATIDGVQTVSKRRFDVYSSRPRRHYFLFDPLPDGLHRVVIRMDPAKFDKLSIVKPNEIKDRNEFKENYLYVGKVLMAGVPIKD